MTGGSHSPRLLPPVMGGIKTQTGGSPGGAKIFKIQGAPPGKGARTGHLVLHCFSGSRRAVGRDLLDRTNLLDTFNYLIN